MGSMPSRTDVDFGTLAALILAPVLAVVSVWLYTLVFVFAACWFTHYLLAELQRLRSLPGTASMDAPLLQTLSP